ncbi:glutathione S-transferase family protein [Devosia ginsengisoli]|uniref:glutathione S-transferase family protein n=1 Tax=Devosia ginsengisoli TaxID=400770 RepID=UPI0026E976A7|nr:glutathione S-transferase family protein [Devosia ginsengisoli]MCR6672356.1 glutathione S-transferase family protein [Devosia ginsengisoli]
MVTLYVANKNYSSWSLRPWILMRELGIPFDEQVRPFTDGPALAFGDVSPSGRFPCLVDGETVVWDSLAIAEYLAETHPKVWPADRHARAFARSAASEMHSSFPSLRNICGMNVGIRVELKEIPAGLATDIARLDTLWTEGLTRFGGPFLAGDSFTAVDAFFCPVAFRVQTYDLKLGAPAAAYARRLLDLPAMQDWYEAALRETWRKQVYENEALAAGHIVADYRQTA